MTNHTLSRIRRNHGLEHATIHVMSEKFKNFSAQGNSDHKGFNLNIYGDISEEDVFSCVEEAFNRMKKGEHHLAVHPNCGTVLLTTATMVTLAAQVVFSVEQRRRRAKLTPAQFLNVLPTAVLLVVLTLIISRPIGVQLQAKYTVEGDLKEMQLLRMRKVSPNPITQFFQFMLTGGQKEVKATAYRIETIN